MIYMIISSAQTPNGIISIDTTLEQTNGSEIDEENLFSYQLQVTDPDIGDEITFEAIDLPSWLQLSQTGLLTGTPDDPDIGTHLVSVKATDTSGASDQISFSLTVNNVNDAPVFNFDEPTSLDEDTLFSLELKAFRS